MLEIIDVCLGIEKILQNKTSYSVAQQPMRVRFYEYWPHVYLSEDGDKRSSKYRDGICHHNDHRSLLAFCKITAINRHL